MPPPQGRLVWGSAQVAADAGAFRYVYTSRRQAESYIREIGEIVTGSDQLSAMSELAAITQVRSGQVPGIALRRNVRGDADPRWVRSMAGRFRVRQAAAAGLSPEQWVRRGGFVGRRNSPRWNLIMDAIGRSAWYAAFVAREYERGPRGGVRTFGRIRPRTALRYAQQRRAS